MNACKVKIVGEHARRRELLGAGDDDAVIALFDDAGVEGWIALLMGRPASVDLRRNDRVARVEVIVAEVLVEPHDVVGEVLATAGKHARDCCKSSKESGDVVGGAAHQTEGRFSP